VIVTLSRKNLLWNLVFVGILAALIGGLYTASLKIDYRWRWYRIPQFIIYKSEDVVKAPFDGRALVAQDKITIVPAGGGEPFVVKSPDETKLRDNDIVLEGGTVAINRSLKAGPLLMGLLTTLEISFFAIIFAIIIGVVAGLWRISGNPALKKLSILYVELIRGTPLLVQIFIFYFFLGTVLNIDRFTAGVAALAVFTGAYVAEIVRAGIQSVHKGQTEAARSLGMSYFQSMTHVILPQAVKRTLPPMAGQFISLIKDSSLVSVISITDLTKAGREISATTFSPFETWFTVAILYLVLTSGLSVLVQKLEKKMASSD
jgi:polar amino acid transport system permease protein